VKPQRIAAIFIVGVVFIAIGVYVAQNANWFPVQASAEAGQVDALFNLMLGIATVIFLIIEGGILGSIIFFRHKKGDETDAAPNHGNTALEVTWTAIPAVIVFILAILSYQLFAQMQAPVTGEQTIDVTAQQFFWQFSYPYQDFPDLTKEQNAAAASNMVDKELHLAVGKPVVMSITARDVMHAFYVPEFRIKQDAIPGKVTNARFTPSLVGTYNVVCTELCGQGHSTMHAPVVVQSQSDYDKYISDLRNNARTAALDPRRADRGKQLMQTKYPCGSCHVLTDAGLAGNVGPHLDGVATRAAANTDNRLTGSGLTNDPANVAQYLRTSIISPSTYLVPGFSDLMPKNFGDPTVMPEDDREAIINYLLTQK